MIWAGLAALLLTLGACAPKPAVTPALLDLDCAAPFEAQRARLASQPGLVHAPRDYAEPYSFYSAEDGRTSYLITEPTAPAHPALMMQKVVAGAVRTTGCPYGDRARYDELYAYLDGLKTWRRK